VFYQALVSATGRLLVQRSPTECGVSECELVNSTMKRPSRIGAVEPLGGGGNIIVTFIHLFTSVHPIFLALPTRVAPSPLIHVLCTDTLSN